MGILKPSITFGLFGLLQLAPQFAPARSPVRSSLLPPCPLAPYTPEVVGTHTHTLAIGKELGVSWSELGSWRELGARGSELEARGVSWGFSKTPGKFQGPRYAQGARGASWEQGEWAGPTSIWVHAYMAPCIYGSMRIRLHAYMAPCIYGSMCIWLHAYTTLRIYSAHSPHS